MARQGIGILIVTAAFALGSTTASAVQLQLKLAKGKTYYQKSTLDQKITQTVMGQEQVIDQTIGTGMKWDVLEVDGQGNMRIRQTFIWCASKQTTPMGTVEYDSAKQATPPAGTEPFAALLGQSYIVKLTPKGDVLDVNGIEELREAVRKKLPGGGDEALAMSPARMYMDKQNVKDMTIGALAVYPDKPVEPGESWNKKVVLSVGFGVITDAKWTLQKREAGVATLVGTAAIRSNHEAPPMEAPGMKLKFNLAGTQESTVRIEEATGLILTDQSKSLLKGETQLSASADATQTMAIPSVFDTTAKVEMSDKPFMPAATPPGAPAKK